MVRIGFIVEGGSERIVIKSAQFQQWAAEHGMSICGDVLDAGGGGNLLPQNIEPLIKQLQSFNPDHIVILTDLENEVSTDAVKNRIGNTFTNLIFIAVKALEAWYLADTSALRIWLKDEQIFEALPEQTPGMPWERLRELARTRQLPGPGSKKTFASRMINHYGFSIANAARHPACPSAREFHDGLLNLTQPQ